MPSANDLGPYQLTVKVARLEAENNLARSERDEWKQEVEDQDELIAAMEAEVQRLRDALEQIVGGGMEDCFCEHVARAALAEEADRG